MAPTRPRVELQGRVPVRVHARRDRQRRAAGEARAAVPRQSRCRFLISGAWLDIHFTSCHLGVRIYQISPSLPPSLPPSLQWPFVRVFGVQEPASVVFSVLNGLTVIIGYVWFVRRAPVAYPYHPLLWLQFWVSQTNARVLLFKCLLVHCRT